MSESFEPDTINVDGLERMLKAVKRKPPIARVGILGSKDARDDKASNATIGAAHEYGAPSRGLPQRSFLRVPLTEMLNKELEKNGFFSEAEFKEVVKLGSVKPWLLKVAAIAEEVVQGAFDSKGYGKWKQSDFTNKKVHMTLVETTDLRKSITSEVKGD